MPVYWGASNICDYVDDKAFIDRRRFRSNAELADYLFSVTEREYADFLGAIERYLASQRFQEFLPPAYAKTIIEKLELKS